MTRFLHHCIFYFILQPIVRTCTETYVKRDYFVPRCLLAVNVCLTEISMNGTANEQLYTDTVGVYEGPSRTESIQDGI